ncbi:glycosyltransferase family 4 protein [Ilumatobacter sp.]|uniref:glycosyltransferase family 4 protein n=1 Tax=Ilumatobacter sp. TaxID=1967498 RepID=UPI003AF5FF84
MEQHLGHRTYYENLKAHVGDDRCDAVWVPVDYTLGDRLERMPLPGSVKAALSARSAVRRGVRSVDADVHVFNTQVPAVLGGRAARSKPYIAITDVTPKQYDRMAAGYDHRPDRAGPVGWAKHQLNLQMFLGASWCVGWSNWACDSMVDDYGVDRARTRAIPPGVDTTVWQPGPERDDGTFKILFVGGDFRRKGGEPLLEAFASLPDDAELTLVTKADVPRTDRVRVIGDLVPNDPRLVELYRTSDVFALPTLAETFGIAAAEAAASGLPVVATDVGGLPDIVCDGVSGFTVPPNDADALATALQRLTDHDERRRLGTAARRHAVERLDAATNAHRLMELVDLAAGAEPR